MAIGNDQELVTAAAQASKLIQNIQDYCGRKLRDDSKHQDILAGASCSVMRAQKRSISSWRLASPTKFQRSQFFELTSWSVWFCTRSRILFG
jgi:hypothetical protein